MVKISFNGKITDFHPTKNSTVKVIIETDLDEKSAKLLWLLDKGLDIVSPGNLSRTWRRIMAKEPIDLYSLDQHAEITEG